MAKKLQMKAPKGMRSATIEGHEYEVPKNGIIDVLSQTHVETLHRHGFTDHEQQVSHQQVDEMDADQLVEFVESHGKDADDLSKKKLRALAHELVDAQDAE